MLEYGFLKYAELREETWKVAWMSLAESLMETQWFSFPHPDEVFLTSSVPDLGGQSSLYNSEFYQLASGMAYEIKLKPGNSYSNPTLSEIKVGIRKFPILVRKDTSKCHDGFTGYPISPHATLQVYSTSLLREAMVVMGNDFELAAIENSSNVPGIPKGECSEVHNWNGMIYARQIPS